MELVFLTLLLLLMVIALTSGFPVAFALPGSAIIAVVLAAVTGYIFAGDTSAYFAQDGPVQWLSAGITNLRSLYWIVERDTLIAIPLFIFMGIMLQRSKIAEDLLVAMAQLFGPLPGGLGISVVFVGALLAATTGIVGATVIAMGLISLPAMLRNNYSKSLACGTICASGTLGQIIPPSIVLIILADQLSSAADQANTARKELYRATTGEFTMPSQYEVVSASAGDMFMGAMVPGMILVGLYMAYILIVAAIKPSLAPPVPYDGDYDSKFFLNVLLALVPPLTLIFIVLGSILLGVATVNQAGSIGAVGAILMAGYRLHTGKHFRYVPAVFAVIAILVIGFLVTNYDLNVKNIKTDDQQFGVTMAAIAVGILLLSVFWSTWRVFRINNILREVMVETAKTTSMVFIILIGAAMLTSAFRAFGGEELVQHYLTSLPGGFWTQFIVVMLVIFLLGFFLDFIEIAVVVVPIVAPILLLNPEANITAVWLGVMIGLNIQTSFLTPPFGFALFYLRGVADKVVKTLDIYKGAVSFIGLQLLGLAIAGYFPTLVNYLPNRTYLTSENAPPPINPKLQLCLETYTIDVFKDRGDEIKSSIKTAKGLDISYLPKRLQQSYKEGIGDAETAIALMADITTARTTMDTYSEEYAPLHREVRATEARVKKYDKEMEQAQYAINDLAYEAGNTDDIKLQLEADIVQMQKDQKAAAASVPAEWEKKHKHFRSLNDVLQKARRKYYNSVDSAYEPLNNLMQTIRATQELEQQAATIDNVENIIANSSDETVMDEIKAVENILGDIKGSSAVKSPLSKARRALKKDKGPEARAKAREHWVKAKAAFDQEITWRQQASTELLPELKAYDSVIANNIGLRSQKKLTHDQATTVARCKSVHRNVSLFF